MTGPPHPRSRGPSKHPPESARCARRVGSHARARVDGRGSDEPSRLFGDTTSALTRVCGALLPRDDRGEAPRRLGSSLGEPLPAAPANRDARRVRPLRGPNPVLRAAAGTPCRRRARRRRPCPRATAPGAGGCCPRRGRAPLVRAERPDRIPAHVSPGSGPRTLGVAALAEPLPALRAPRLPAGARPRHRRCGASPVYARRETVTDTPTA